MSEKKCEHAACTCPAREGSNYCCDECERARGETDCGCGHAECQAQA